MRNILILTVAAAMITGAVLAEELTGSVAAVLKELQSYQSETPAAVEPAPAEPMVEPAVVEPAPAAVEAAAAEPMIEPAIVEAAPAEAVVEPVDPEALMEESQELYVSGELEAAREGFEKIIKTEPENIVARMYLRKLIERDFRHAEKSGMAEVSNAWKTDLVQRAYAINGDAAKKLNLGDATDPVDVEDRFPEVSFPKGASAVYQPKRSKIFVRNTRENLEVLEAMLDEMDAVVFAANIDQVEIEAKFLEVSEGTLEELGFQWNFTDPNEVSFGSTDLQVSDGSGGLFSEALRASPGSSSPGLPFSRPASLPPAGEVDPSVDSWSAFRFEDTFSPEPDSLKLQYRGKNRFDLLISALDQSTGTDVLSAPRVVTESGQPATIRVGQRHYFPEVFEVGANEGAMVHVRYEDFEEKLLGVELKVTPQVVGTKIEMNLNPKITELLGWENHAVSPANSSYTHWQGRLTLKFQHNPLYGRLPIYKKREINTAVTIADGGTIGMGGLINEKVESFEDKVPLLGSIPLVGRLFRNEGERAVKRNLLMFVTAKKVDPSGRVNTVRSFE